MNKEEVLTRKYSEFRKKHTEAVLKFYTNPSIARIEPFKIADNLYYVGDKKVCVHLIDTGDGLILIDSGYFGAAHLLVDSIWRAGFDPENVRWIIHTHGHHDHFGASEEFRNMYGTKLAISKVDANELKREGTALINKSFFPLAKVPEFDYEIEDGEIFELGNTKIRCVLTPGHTPGVLSLFFDVTYEGKTYLAGMFGGAGTNAVKLPYIFVNKLSEDMPYQMLDSVEKLRKEPVMVHLGNHPGNNHTLEKYEQLKEGGNPFIDADSWGNFLSNLKVTIEKIIENNNELKKQYEG